MKKQSIPFVIVTLIISILLSSCAAGSAMNGGASVAPDADGVGGYGGGFSGAPESGYDGGYGGATDSYAPSDPGDGADDGVADSTDKSESNIIESTAGLITASAWDDNFYYSEWLALFAQSDDGSAGRLSAFLHSDRSWGFDTRTRVKLTVKNGDSPVAGARVSVDGKDGQLGCSAITDARGIAYLFPDESGNITVTLGDTTATASFDAQSRDLTVELSAASKKRDVIELMFVIDATGSMGDEISYLKNEIADVVGRISDGNDTTVYLSFLFYRDHCDSVVFDYVDFANVSTPSGLEAQRTELSKRYATGGGDYAEAAEEALLLAAGKQWSSETTTKIIFQLLDAPPHNTDENKSTMQNAVAGLASQGIRFCPVLCSGADTLTEYVMREAAVYTGGTFVYVTDHSGIGGSHHDPDIPNATVEALNSLMVRLVRGYHSGVFEDPVDWRADQNK